MNQRVAKFQRREVRKLVGSEAVKAIFQQGDITEQTIIPALTALQTLSQNFAERLDAIDEDKKAFRAKSVWGRLSWMIFGE